MDTDKKDTKAPTTILDASTSAATNILVVSIEMPDFYMTVPSSWFLCATAHFGLGSVTHSGHVV